MRAVLSDQALLGLPAGADVVVLPTAADFTGAAQSALAIAEIVDALGTRVEALMVTDRVSSAATYFGERLTVADLVVLGDGSPLHARSVWRNTVVGEGIVAAPTGGHRRGGVDARSLGGAPMMGLSYRPGVAFATPSSDDQLARTRSLMPDDTDLVVLGPRGVAHYDGVRWRVVCDDGVVVTRGHDVVTL